MGQEWISRASAGRRTVCHYVNSQLQTVFLLLVKQGVVWRRKHALAIDSLADLSVEVVPGRA